MTILASLWMGLALSAATLADLPTVHVVDAPLMPGQRGTGLWRPTIHHVDAARKALRRYLADASVKDRNGWERANREAVRLRYEEYILQMQGVRRSTGKHVFDTEGSGARQIRIEGFCPGVLHGVEERIKREPLLISDGGTCIFQATYDVDSDRITSFTVNGLA